MNWKYLDVKLIKNYCLDTFEKYNVYPSVRDIFYAFVDELFPNTKTSYRGLVKYLVTKRLKGEIDWRIIRDGSGRELVNGDDSFQTSTDYFKSWLYSFSTCYEDFNLPKWLHQKNIVVVLCEKEADYPIVKSILQDLNVFVGYMRGYCGKRLMFEIRKELERKPDKKLIIMLLGDFDPSGDDIKDNVRRDLLKLGIEIKPVNLAVTKEQIEKFKLPHKPEDEKEIEKLQRDPRFNNWIYGLYRVETASLRVKQPDYFDEILRNTVLKFFDSEVYEKVREEEKKKRRAIKRMIKKVI